MHSLVRRGDVALVSPASTRRRFVSSWGGGDGGGGAGKSRFVIGDKTRWNPDGAGTRRFDRGNRSFGDLAADGLAA